MLLLTNSVQFSLVILFYVGAGIDSYAVKLGSSGRLFLGSWMDRIVGFVALIIAIFLSFSVLIVAMFQCPILIEPPTNTLSSSLLSSIGITF